MKLLITLLVTLGISMGSYGSFMTGAQLLERCESEGYKEAVCLGYIQGVADAFESLMKLGLMTETICIPNQVTVGQLTKVVVKCLNEHPEELHYRADGEVYLAYAEAFPCEK